MSDTPRSDRPGDNWLSYRVREPQSRRGHKPSHTRRRGMQPDAAPALRCRDWISVGSGETRHVTQILGAMRRGHLFQTSDRRLSYRDSSPYRPADHRSNKSLIVLTGKDISLFGYCGNAMIGDYPTDDWIAGAICATDCSRWGVPVNDNQLHHYSVGQVIQSLRTCVHEHRRRESPARLRDFYLQILIVGYKTSRQLRGPYVFKLVWAGPDGHGSNHDRPIVPSLQHGALYASPWLGSGLHADVMREMGRPVRGPKDFLDNMASATTTVAQQRDGVGPSLLGICLYAPTLMAFLSYRLEQPDTLAVGRDALPLFWTPWVIVPHRFHQPSVVSGNGTLVVSPLQLVLPRVEGPTNAVVFVNKRLDRTHNSSADPIKHRYETQGVEVQLDAGHHEVVLKSHPVEYQPPQSRR